MFWNKQLNQLNVLSLECSRYKIHIVLHLLNLKWMPIFAAVILKKGTFQGFLIWAHLASAAQQWVKHALNCVGKRTSLSYRKQHIQICK